MMIFHVYHVFPIILCIGYVSCMCTQPNIVHPCYCEHGRQTATLHCKDLEDEDYLAETYQLFDGSDFEVLKISNSVLSYIPSYSPILISVHTLYVQNSTVDFLFADMPPPELDTLILDDVTFRHDIYWEYFEDLDLRNLMVRDVEINTIDSEFALNMRRNLRTLILKNTNTSDLEDEIFKNFVYLEDLRIESSRIKTLERNMFARPAERLQTLSFEDNDIKFLPKDLFADMPNLKNVDFSFNNIEIIPVTLFRNIKHFLRISFEDNPLRCDCKMRWLVWKRMTWEDAFSRNVGGVCKEPEELSGVELRDLTPDDFEECPSTGAYLKILKIASSMHVQRVLQILRKLKSDAHSFGRQATE